jgi:hypothetical protein
MIVSYKCVMKHEGYIPATVVSGGDTLTIRKKISGSAYLSACEIAVIPTTNSHFGSVHAYSASCVKFC